MIPYCTLRRFASRLRQAAGTRRGPAPGIPEVVQELENLNRLTEKDFLRVGEKLLDIRSSARRLSSDLAALSESISGQAASDACQALRQAQEYSRALSARLDQSGRQLSNVLDCSAKLQRAFSGLPQTVSFFRTICTLTRIETMSLGRAGVDFGNLADEVRPLSEQIQLSGNGVLATASQLDHGVQSAIHKGRDLGAREIENLNSLGETVLRSLKTFAERRRQAQESSARQASQYASLCEAIDDLVGSIQFHDITRQQIEHVASALRNADFSRSDVSLVIELQESQLAEAGRAFSASVERIESALAGIAARLREMTESSRDLMGISSADQESFFESMEAALASILQAARSCSATDTELGRLAGQLRTLIDVMQTSIAEIRGTEINIERIAINATIHAAQIGASGKALNVVAESMRNLAMQSNGNTERAADMLTSMLASLSTPAEEKKPNVAAPNPALVFDHIRATIGALHASSELSLARVKQITDVGTGVAEEISALRSDFSAGRVFAETLDRVLGVLSELRSRGAPAPPAPGAPAAVEQLAHLAESYTMQRQRDVHEAVLAGASPGPTAIQTPAPAPESNLGDNVDLF